MELCNGKRRRGDETTATATTRPRAALIPEAPAPWPGWRSVTPTWHARRCLFETPRRAADTHGTPSRPRPERPDADPGARSVPSEAGQHLVDDLRGRRL